MTAEQWLNDLEAKANAAHANWDKKYSGADDSPEVLAQFEANMRHMNTANPAAVLRLVEMVRVLAEPQKKLIAGWCHAYGSAGCEGACASCNHARVFIALAYKQAEPKP